jgi:hypothetical protein
MSSRHITLRWMVADIIDAIEWCRGLYLMAGSDNNGERTWGDCQRPPVLSAITIHSLTINLFPH